jgi:hypothetical protein
MALHLLFAPEAMGGLPHNSTGISRFNAPIILG